MVVRIKSPHSLQKALNYNEKKVQKGHAECIHAGNYILEANQLNFYQKMERMATLMALNERSKKSNTLHISLNFDPTEKLPIEKLAQIARTYMEKIGFAEQPYLVYRHDDAGHPHIHILTTSIQSDGKRIDTFNIGKNQSEKARKEIEQDFGLVRAEGKKLSCENPVIPVNVQKVQYGKSETIRSITNVLDAVVNHFKYTSLAELNAVLQQYNIAADRGQEDRLIFKRGGLLYRLLDEKGNKIGVPVKASLIHSKPTLKNLEKRFEENKTLREPDRKKLRTSFEWVLNKSPKDLEDFIKALQKEKIQTILRQNKEGLVYGITFIDYRTKSVFNGSDIGKQYSIAGLQDRLSKSGGSGAITKDQNKAQQEQQEKSQTKENGFVTENPKDSILKDVMDTEKSFNRLPADLLKKKKKKRNKNI